MKNQLKLLTVVIGLMAISASCGNATLVTYFGEDLVPGFTVPPGGNAETAQANYLSALSGGVGTEDFESLAVGTPVPIGLSFPGSTGAITATLTGGSSSVTTAIGGIFPTSGTNFLATQSGGSFNIAFSSPIAAFGFYGTDIGDFGGQLSLTLTNGGATVINVPNTVGAPDGSLLFFGFTDDANSYTNIAFGNSSGTDQFGFDDMIVGDLQQVQGVPEGGSTILMLGFAVIGMLRFSQRKNA